MPRHALLTRAAAAAASGEIRFHIPLTPAAKTYCACNKGPLLLQHTHERERGRGFRVASGASFGIAIAAIRNADKVPIRCGTLQWY